MAPRIGWWSVAAAAFGQEVSTTTQIEGGPVQQSRAATPTGKGLMAAVSPGQLHVFPPILDGNGWVTTFYLSNLEDHGIRVNRQFVAPDGTPALLPLMTPPD